MEMGLDVWPLIVRPKFLEINGVQKHTTFALINDKGTNQVFYIKSTRGPFIYYVITFLGFLDPPPPLRQHVFSTKNKQKLAFSDPPSLLQVRDASWNFLFFLSDILRQYEFWFESE